MTVYKAVLCLICLCNFAQYECETICFSCTGLSEGKKCHNAISCAENEVCFTQKYRTTDNITKYDVGCSYPELCRKDSTGVIFGKRIVDHSHVICHQCCQDNVCNSVLTCNDNFKVPSLSCLSCSGIISTGHCNNTIACNKNEVCFTQKYRTTLNEEYYDLGCKSSSICMNGFYSNIFGRRSDNERHLLCESCCGGSSFCNRDLSCNHHNQTSVNGSCTSTSGCKSNLVCLSGNCQCPTDDYYWSTNTCTLLKGNNNVCASTKECRNPLHCLSNSCTCPSKQYWDGSICNSRKIHNAPCKISAECSETLFCNHGVCKCDRIDYWTGNNCTTRNTFSHYCLSDDDCQETLFCVHNECCCNNTELWNGTICLDAPRECNDIQFKVDGVYTIYPKDVLHPKPVFCVFQNGIKWTVIQRRFNGSVDFYRNWTSYKNGFGNAHGEYWLGDSLMNVQLIGRAAGQIFSTVDNDNGTSFGQCASNLHSGWWYSQCEYADLNRIYSELKWDFNIGNLTQSMIMISRNT